MQKLAIYDMDRTITRSGTYTPFLLQMVLARAPWRLLLAPFTLLGFAAYGLKLTGRKGLKTWNQRLLLGSSPSLEKLQPHIERFADRTLRDNSLASAISQLEEDRKEGRTLVLATASYELYVEAIARRLDIPHVIATRLKITESGAVLPRIIGENCYDSAKLERITAWLEEQGLNRTELHIRAYSDHVSDAPMLQFADEAVATTPSPALRRLATERGWKIVDWSQSQTSPSA
ncbi:HAD-superfamily subfamily IB hydrolase, TIGR01490 [Parasphingorhabdus marina DSM 22363]|uniref:HAD-superfamily subfamily IB hydrolase, TIGR01490 n=1 Tax=Parasphingorhabdus marina DSM 22363 TaxID=1123272 RepID=A0A1N6DEF7_9SPHN|nr:HAD-IB family hydrolase [Parasphingorhabdus marina]SIN69053.1 HAD-superfamily subfamily IB hydrolase, TIGR01490 [Parasphingorhabdus marina DSM 22363]